MAELDSERSNQRQSDFKDAAREHRIWHGVILASLIVAAGVFDVLSFWPWYLLLPITVYGLIITAIPRLKCQLLWLGIGRMDRKLAIMTLTMSALTVCALLAFQAIHRIDLSSLAGKLPAPFGSVVFGWLLFSLLNALLEELVFRGVLMDALVARLNVPWALAIQAIAFGAAHANGYPPGAFGIILAGVFGLAMACLRLWTGGLFSPWMVHAAADATIYAMVVGLLRV